jgi:transcriptional regulator with XRE-family HTH domain
MPDRETERYNALGRYVVEQKGALSLAEVARRGDINQGTMGRWLRGDIRRLPPPEVLQGIADGLGRPLSTVQRVAMRAVGPVSPLTTLDDEQQTVVEAMAGLDVYWRRMVVDQVLRLVEEVARAEERRGQ